MSPLKKGEKPRDDEWRDVAHLTAPRSWERDAWGAPSWIVAVGDSELGPWKTIIPPLLVGQEHPEWSKPDLRHLLRSGPARMPVMRAKHVAGIVGGDPREGKRGRPGRRKERPHAIRAAAWLRDVRELSLAAIGASLALTDADERNRRKAAVAYVEAGRNLLHDDGVLPWVIWPGGAVPDDWWADALFSLALKGWHDLYVAPHREELLEIRDRYARAVAARSSRTAD